MSEQLSDTDSKLDLQLDSMPFAGRQDGLQENTGTPPVLDKGRDHQGIAGTEAAQEDGATKESEGNTQPSISMQEMMTGFQLQQVQLLGQMKIHQEAWQQQTEKNLQQAISQQMESTHVRIADLAEECDSNKQETERAIKTVSQTEGILLQEFKALNANQVLEQSKLQATVTDTNDKCMNLMVTQQDKVLVEMKYQHDELVNSLERNQKGLIEAIQRSQKSAVSSIEDVNKNVSDAIKQMTDAVLGMTRSLATNHKEMTKTLTNLSADLMQNVHSINVQADERFQRLMDNPHRRSDSISRMDHGMTMGFTDSSFRELPSKLSGANAKDEKTLMSGAKGKGKKTKSSDSEDSSETSSSGSGSSSSGGDDSSSSTEEDATSHSSRKKTRRRYNNPKLPSCKFTGQERWKIWYKRFKVGVKGVPKKQKLKVLLGMMHGDAAEFVFDQMPKKARRSYRRLVREMAVRYRLVENPRTYGAMFSNRGQKTKESIVDFAADLKRLYDKAHPDRDAKTRREDLLRRFLDGLKDTEAASQVEFVRTLTNIDEAVDAVVNFQELHGKREKKDKTSRIRGVSTSSSDSAAEEEGVRAVNRGPGRPPKVQQQKTAGNKPQPVSDNKPQSVDNTNKQQTNQDANTSTGQDQDGQNTDVSNLQNAVTNQGQKKPPQNNNQGGQKFGNWNKQQTYQGKQSGNWQNRNYGNQGYNQNYGQGYSQGGNQQRNREFHCFKCGGPNHIAKFCHATAVVGQMQLPQGAIQPLPVFNNMLPNSTYTYQQSGNTGNQQTPAAADQTVSSPNVTFQLPGAWGMTGNTVVPAGTAVPAANPQYLPNNQPGNQ